MFRIKAAQAMGLEKDMVCVMIHSGSRGLGYQVCDDALAMLRKAPEKYGIALPDRQLAEQAQEWIFRLRDQMGFQASQPGWVDIFTSPHDNPAFHLVQLGDAALPALVAALSDSRPTRAVGYGRDLHFSHEVVTVGDATP